ncbi:MAG TPA: serine--tRNA ligase [Nitrososphaerales archaeon]|nr:serine--tRNA ligase [Nitrososphaerales archaeon]
MLDVKLLREDPETIRKDLRRREATEKLHLVDEASEMDKDWRRLKTQVEELRHRQNLLTAKVSDLKKRGEPLDSVLLEIKDIPDQIKKMDDEAGSKLLRLNEVLMSLPNILDESVPKGRDDTENVTVRTWGSPPRPDFKLKDHIDILEALGQVDIERASKISGSRFYFLKGDSVKLEHSIMRYALDLLSKKGFIPVEPPFMMRREPYSGVTDLADFGPVIYRIEGEDLYMIATSEHPLVAMHMDEIVDGKALPIKYCGVSPCFRVEAGAHGKDTKGIFRTHQFYKVEQIVFSRPSESWPLHEELIANAEGIFQSLGIHYRVVNVCTGDMGSVAAKKYDLEAWLPAQQRFREMVSCSNCTDYQSRRLKIRFRERQDEPTTLVHTLNSTAVTTRALVAIAENFQQRDGTIRIPRPLVPYMNGQEEISHQ